MPGLAAGPLKILRHHLVAGAQLVNVGGDHRPSGAASSALLTPCLEGLPGTSGAGGHITEKHSGLRSGLGTLRGSEGETLMRGQLFRCLESCDGDVTVPEHEDGERCSCRWGGARPSGRSVLLRFGAWHSRQECLASCGLPTAGRLHWRSWGASYSIGPWPVALSHSVVVISF